MSPPVLDKGAIRTRVFRSLLRSQPDSRLVALIQLSEAAAFDELSRRHGGRLLKLSQSMGADSYSAEDIVQESLLKAKKAIESGTAPALVGPWLRAIVRNATLNWIRDTPAHEEFTAAAAPSADPAQVTLQRERIRSIVVGLTELPRKQREALVGRELEGLSHVELGERLGVSTGAVRQLIFRARAQLRERSLGLILPMPALLAARGGIVGQSAPATAGAAGAVSGTGTAGAGLTGWFGGAKLAAGLAALAGVTVALGPAKDGRSPAQGERPAERPAVVQNELRAVAATELNNPFSGEALVGADVSPETSRLAVAPTPATGRGGPQTAPVPAPPAGEPDEPALPAALDIPTIRDAPKITGKLTSHDPRELLDRAARYCPGQAPGEKDLPAVDAEVTEVAATTTASIPEEVAAPEEIAPEPPIPSPEIGNDTPEPPTETEDPGIDDSAR